jgi:hypothetical protein
VVSALPPVLTEKFKVIDVGVVVTELIAGADGTVYGVAVAPLASAPVPAAFTRRKRGVYPVPLTNPVMTNGEVVAPLRIQCMPPSMLYSVAVIGLPLLLTVYASASDPLPDVTVEMVGADGTVNGVP